MPETETKSEVFTMAEMEDGEERVNKRSLTFETYVQPFLAELFGTILFVFVACSSAIGNTGPGIIQPALASGLAVGVLITVFGKISGGHFNPVVSLIFYFCGGMELVLLVPYFVAQMVGSIAGAGLARAVYPSSQYQVSHGGAFSTVFDDLAEATLTEVITTTILTFVVAMMAVNKRTSSPVAPFCVGLIVAANIWAGGPVSGACMNPARAFGPAVVANHWTYHWVYWAGPICGVIVSASVVRLLFGDKKTRIVFK
ncbi:uncharacterized protein V6R79_010130 [Siganus canaliculatus]